MAWPLSPRSSRKGRVAARIAGTASRSKQAETAKYGGVNVDDCAAVSRQLARVLPVEGVDYEQLEVSSPGLDRPLRKRADFERFAGHRADVRMRTPDASGRRRFVGVLRGTAEQSISI